jgi:cytochrome c oxidase subunit 2
MFDFPLFPENASTFAPKVDALYFFALAVSIFFTVLIFVGTVWLFVKYRRKHAEQVGVPIHGSLVLEIIWSVIPFIITMVMFGWGAQVFFVGMMKPPGTKEYFAVAKQWMWKFQHPEGHREINTLHVPVGEKISITMTSDDVIHSFFVPAFRVKMDVLPGRYTSVWFEATKVGEYHLFCTEYCGAEHSQMIGTVSVMNQDDYQRWLEGGTVGSPPVAAGGDLFRQYACNTCHDAGDTSRGPSLVGIAGKEVTLQNGRRVVRDDNYLREAILHPTSALVQGYQNLMPTYQGQIDEQGVANLLMYIKSLGAPADPPAGPAAASNAHGAE